MSRPVKTPDQSRSKLAKFRVTEAEFAQLDQLATDAGLTVSDYLRGVALNAKPRQVKATPDRAAFITALGTLGHIRSDMNQVLKDRWAYKFVTSERVEGIFAALDRIADQIHTDLER